MDYILYSVGAFIWLVRIGVEINITSNWRGWGLLDEFDGGNINILTRKALPIYGDFTENEYCKINADFEFCVKNFLKNFLPFYF